MIKIHIRQNTCTYYTAETSENLQMRKKKKESEREKQKNQVLPRFELGSWDSESQVLTVTPQNHHTTNCWLIGSGISQRSLNSYQTSSFCEIQSSTSAFLRLLTQSKSTLAVFETSQQDGIFSLREKKTVNS